VYGLHCSSSGSTVYGMHSSSSGSSVLAAALCAREFAAVGNCSLHHCCKELGRMTSPQHDSMQCRPLPVMT
jgi:hypothetical protein